MKNPHAIWARFDEPWYFAHYDVTGPMHAAGLNDAALYYHEIGAGLGHSPNAYFDEVWYLDTHADVAALVALGKYRSGFAHYLALGFESHAPHWLFSDRFYLAGNTDLTRSRLEEAGLRNGYDHYLAYGDAEFRSGHLFFNPVFYAAHKPSQDLAGGAFKDFLADDCRSGSAAKLSPYFDPQWYLTQYPQVAAEIAAGHWSCALQHYLCNHTPEKFDPCPYFNEAFYASVHVDIGPALESGQFRNGYDHFIQFGVFECRKPTPAINLAEYFRSVEVQADIQSGLVRDVFAHYIGNNKNGGGLRAAPEVDEALGKALFATRAANLRPYFARTRLVFQVRETPALSVILVMYNQLDLTLSALDSLRRCYAGDIELILVDNGSADESRVIERYVTGAKIVRFAHNAGFVEACNAGLQHVTAPVTLYMNNDVLLESNAVAAALVRLESAGDIGAVGGKVIRTNGKLQEAGCIIWRDGGTEGYLRGGEPNAPEANFVRDVDFCSAVFLAVRSEILKSLGGFDATFKPAYFEEADLCVRLYQAGYRVVYDPAVMLTHQEYSSGDYSIALGMMAQNQPKFIKKNKAYLKTKYPQNPILLAQARAVPGEGLRILLIEDRIPLRALGSGFTRSNDIIRSLAALGHQVTVFPIYEPIESLLSIYRDFPDTVEVIHDREMKDLAEFIAARSGYYDYVWISRTHNAERLAEIFNAQAEHLPMARMILDTEAVAAVREQMHQKLRGETPAMSLAEAVAHELAPASYCTKVVAVNAADAALIRQAGFGDVSVLGHVRQAAPTPRPFAARHGLLFVGAIHDQDSPNLDGLTWFTETVLPYLDALLPEDVAFTIAGYVNRRIDLSQLAKVRRVILHGAADDLASVYDSHRVFVAPTRYAGGIAYKLHEAASYGLPVVATTILAAQLGWQDGVELLVGDITSPDEFAGKIARLYHDQGLWESLRAQALAQLTVENNERVYQAQLSALLAN